jgi:hypothetical protein
LRGAVPALPSGAKSERHLMPSPRSSPSDILYLLLGTKNYHGPSIGVFDADDTSSKPKPLYTIAPYNKEYYEYYSYLAVDSHNNLFAAVSAKSEDSIEMFESGARKTSVTCPLPAEVSSLYVSGGILYVGEFGYSNTIAEYAEPFSTKTGCGKPVKMLTDKLADKQNADGIEGMVVDSAGNLFDAFTGVEGSDGFAVMDEFEAGSRVARKFLSIKNATTPRYLTVDRNKDIVTNLLGGETVNDVLAVFPHETKKPKLYYPNAAYWQGVALTGAQTELFASSTYPAAVHVFGFDPKTGAVGDERTFGDVQPYGGSLVIFSK